MEVAQRSLVFLEDGDRCVSGLGILWLCLRRPSQYCWQYHATAGEQSNQKDTCIDLAHLPLVGKSHENQNHDHHHFLHHGEEIEGSCDKMLLGGLSPACFLFRLALVAVDFPDDV